MSKILQTIIALSLLAAPSFADTYGTDIWTDLKSYNFTTQSLWDSHSRLRPIESFSEPGGETIYAHYLIGTASNTSIINTAPLNISGYKYLSMQLLSSDIGTGTSSPTISSSGTSAHNVCLWGRPGKDDVWDTTTKNLYKSGVSGTGSASGSTAIAQVISVSGETTYVRPPMTATTKGTYVWEIGGAYGGLIISASANTTCNTTTHIFIRATK